MWLCQRPKREKSLLCQTDCTSATFVPLIFCLSNQGRDCNSPKQKVFFLLAWGQSQTVKLRSIRFIVFDDQSALSFPWGIKFVFNFYVLKINYKSINYTALYYNFNNYMILNNNFVFVSAVGRAFACLTASIRARRRTIIVLTAALFSAPTTVFKKKWKLTYHLNFYIVICFKAY